MNTKEIIETYLEYCGLRKELNTKTLKAYRIDLMQYSDFVHSDNPQKSEIERYITALHKKYKQKTIKRKIAVVKAFYAFLEDEEFISENPFRKIKVKFKETSVLPRLIPRGEIELLLNCMYAYPRSHADARLKYWFRDMAIVEVLFATGARVYEISNLQKDCVDLDSGSIRIMGKGGRERYIQISEHSILDLLCKYYNANKTAIEKSDFFFVNKRGNRFTEQSIRDMVKKYSRLAGISRNITPHMFRHSFATFLVENGVDVSFVQQILGHSSIRTTQIYLHITANRQAEILRTMHPRNQMQIIGIHDF